MQVRPTRHVVGSVPSTRTSVTRTVDGASLGVFRLVFGLVGVVSGVRILANGWVETLYSGPAHHLTYPGFSWVRPPPVWGTYLLVAVIIVGAVWLFIRWRRGRVAPAT